MRAAFHLCVIPFALAFAACHREVTDGTIHFKLAEDAHVSVLIEDANGKPVRQLVVDERRSKGRQAIFWDGKDGGGRPAPAGRYRWCGVSHLGFGARLRGWACAGLELPWQDDRKDFQENGGAPSAVAAHNDRVYLGWTSGRISACDSSRRAVWSARLPDGASCETLGVDGGIIYALARTPSEVFTSDEIVRFDARLGTPSPWPLGGTIPVQSLWPADAPVRPAQADGMCVRSGRIYLTFTSHQFLAVLDASTGAYLQTVVGGAPTLIDATPTKTESPDRPGEWMDVDFAVVALRGGVLGKVLFAHDPLWVVTSEMQPMDNEERITALALLGDAAKHHRHSVFVGLDAPFCQVQRRSVLNTEGFQWTTGRSGGRPSTGQWQTEALGPIRAVALDGEGRLWVAEGDDVPPRFSIWNTEGTEGHLLHELFGPLPQTQSGAAVLPSDPNVFVGAGCEWRLDPNTGESRCLGVISHEPMVTAEFVPQADGRVELRLAAPSGAVRVFERRGDGDYLLLSESKEHDSGFEMPWLIGTGTYGMQVPGQAKIASGTVSFADRGFWWQLKLNETMILGDLFGDDDGLAKLPASAAVGVNLSHVPRPHFGSITQGADGRIYAGATSNGLMNLEITGLDTVRALPGGDLTLLPATP